MVGLKGFFEIVAFEFLGSTSLILHLLGFSAYDFQMHRRPHHKSVGHIPLDNRFQKEPLHLAQTRNCCDFARQNQIQRMYQEFEVANQRRLVRRADSYEPVLSSRRQRSIGNAAHSYRPATGVDLALGLNGYQSVSFPHPPRIPSTLSSLGVEETPPSIRPRSCMDRERVSHMLATVQAQKQAEEIERKKLVQEAQEKKVQMESEELLSERSRQLGQVMAKDWNYQRSLKEKQKLDEQLQIAQEVLDRNKRLEEETRLQQTDRLEKERTLADERRQDLNDHQERKHKEDLEHYEQEQREVCQYAQEDLEEKLDKDRSNYESRNNQLTLRQHQLNQIEKKAMKANHNAYNTVAAEKAKNEQNTRVLDEERLFYEREKERQLAEQQEYHEFLQNGAKQKAREEDFENKHTEQAKREVQASNYNSMISKQRERDSQRMEVNDFIVGQIKEREKLAQASQMSQEREMEQRLREEQEYANAIQEKKENLQRAQLAYRKSLQAQIEERELRRQNMEQEHQRFTKEVEHAENRENREVNHKMRKLNLLESHIRFDY
ncbi:calponin homology domain-containing protein DDB_G0272472-like isoform X2 [Tigriopus californicus]|uniref:calponin homology domain-containing protein DDB_G0272472-like isoform X2 n=1 Tax=Tigriopus californicus TaxID=6832 RepID=UPI0027DA8CE9|nr:calponin homology domain-containing protein DDB_G0272472-like isoform X2 [Tigriopus californicus]